MSISPMTSSNMFSLRSRIVQEIVLDGALGREVDDLHRPGLAHAMDAAHALLDALRVPGQVKVEHQAAELEVAPLAGSLGGEEDLRALLEAADGLVLVLSRELAVIENSVDTYSPQKVQPAESSVARKWVKYDELLLPVGSQSRHQKPFQGLRFGPRLQAARALG